MKLSEHADFRTFITAAAHDRSLPEAFVEKDYWITSMLRVIALREPERAIFKGGTSLSKGWDMLDRFSEDIDLFVHPGSPTGLAPREIDRCMEGLRDACLGLPGLALLSKQTRSGSARNDTFGYHSNFASVPGFPASVLLEAGIQSGDFPSEILPLTSIVADVITGRGARARLESDGIDDLGAFPMKLLHFRRTFVEKLFAIHGKVERLKQDGTRLGRDARHYADLYVLGQRPEVGKMLASDEYLAIRTDYDETSQRYFAKTYRPPPGLRFGMSDALFPPKELRATIESDYAAEVTRLYYRGSPPPFDDVLALMTGLEPLL